MNWKLLRPIMNQGPTGGPPAPPAHGSPYPTPPPTVPTPAPVLSGGPGAAIPPAPGAPAAPPAPAAATPPGPAPIYRGMGGEMRTTEELAAYTRSLEARLVEESFKPKPEAPPAAPPPAAAPPSSPPRSWTHDIAEEIFTNPTGAIEKIVTNVRKEVREENASAERKKKFWDEFYAENPDLSPVRFVVDSVCRDKDPELAPLAVSAAKALIASEARKRVDSVRQTTGIVETVMAQGSATVIGSSGSGSPPKQAGAPQNVSFVGQIKQFRNRARQ